MEIKHFELAVDGSRGIYVPKFFAENYPSCMDGSERDILLAGPEHEEYWDVWNNVSFREHEEQSLYLGESGDVFILSDSPMQALITAWESMEDLDSSAAELRGTVQKLASEFLTDRDEFISEEEALDYFKPSQYNDSLVKKALEWMRAGRVRIDPLVSGVIGLDEVPRFFAGGKDAEIMKMQIEFP